MSSLSSSFLSSLLSKKYLWIQGIKVNIDYIQYNCIELSWTNSDKSNIGSYPFHDTKEERQLQMIYNLEYGVCSGGRFDDNEFTFNISNPLLTFNQKDSQQILQSS